MKFLQEYFLNAYLCNTIYYCCPGPYGINPNYGVETPYLVESSSNQSTELAILKRFPFDSAIKRMTVRKKILKDSITVVMRSYLI